MSWCLVSVSGSRRPYHNSPLMTSCRRVKVDEKTLAGCISDSCYTCMLHTDCQGAHFNCLTGRAIGVGCSEKWDGSASQVHGSASLYNRALGQKPWPGGSGTKPPWMLKLFNFGIQRNSKTCSIYVFFSLLLFL